MANKAIEFIKAHPIGVALGVAAIGGIYIYNHSGSGAATNVSGTDSQLYQDEVAAGAQYQTAQLQANQAALQSNNEAAVANNQITAQEVIAGLQSQDTLAGISAQAVTQQNADTLSAQTTQAVSLLQAQVAENTTAAQVQENQLNDQSLVTVATAPYTEQTSLATINAQVTNHANDLAAQIALAQIAAAQNNSGTTTTSQAATPINYAQYATTDPSQTGGALLHAYETYLNRFNAQNGLNITLAQEGAP